MQIQDVRKSARVSRPNPLTAPIGKSFRYFFGEINTAVGAFKTVVRMDQTQEHARAADIEVAQGRDKVIVSLRRRQARARSPCVVSDARDGRVPKTHTHSSKSGISVIGHPPQVP